VNAFGFDFDHASGYYSRLAGDICGSPLIYELIAEMGDIDSEARSVKKPKSSRSSLNRGQILSKKSATFWDHALGPVEINLDWITAATAWIMAAKL
jgi:hypothetical protein